MAKKTAKPKRAKARSRSTKRADASTQAKGVGRKDGFANALTGLGTSNDKRTQSVFDATATIDDQQLAGLFRCSGMGKRIARLPASDMTRNWFRVAGDPEDKALQRLQELGAQMHTNSAIKWSRVFGGAIMIIGMNGGEDFDKPVDEKAIKSIDNLMVFDRREVQVDQGSISKDLQDPKVGQPQLYRVTPIMGGTPVVVHESRIIRFDGAELPHREMIANSWWHDSIYQAAYEALRQMFGVMDSTEFIVEDFVQTVIQIDNLFAMMAAGKEDLIKDRLKLVDQSRHTANTLLMDKNEIYSKHTATVTGLDKILDRFMMVMSAAVGIPITLLMGRSPGGENATGESDIRFYYDTIRGDQKNELSPRLERLVRYIYLSDGFEEPETWSISWNPVRELSMTEWAELYKANAEGDQLYIQNEVLDPLQVAKHRFAGEEYNPAPPAVDLKELEKSAEEEKLRKEKMAALAAKASAALGAKPEDGDEIPPGEEPGEGEEIEGEDD